MHYDIEHGAIVEHYDNFKIHKIDTSKVVFKMYGKLKTYKYKKGEPFSLAAAIHKAGRDFVEESVKKGFKDVADGIKNVMEKVFG